MQPSKRFLWFFALAAIVAVTAACGAPPAEEPPAEETAAEEEATPAGEETTVEPVTPDPVEEEVQEPTEPPLEGDIVEVGEGQMDWNRGATREQPGEYYWVVRLRNDTTEVLDITVTYQFLDANEEVIKTDTETVRVSPAQTGEFRVVEEMGRDDARAVAFTTYFWDWERVQG